MDIADVRVIDDEVVARIAPDGQPAAERDRASFLPVAHHVKA
jgi:hypothetical protein